VVSDKMTTVKIEGLSELKDALEELSKATARNVQKRALIEAAGPLEADAERLAPFRKGTLKRSITISPKLSSRQRSLHKPTAKVEMFVGPGSLVQAITSEFGTSHSAPRPFMRPAWDKNKKPMLLSIRDFLAEQIEKARQRAARKAARILAKMQGAN